MSSLVSIVTKSFIQRNDTLVKEKEALKTKKTKTKVKTKKLSSSSQEKDLLQKEEQLEQIQNLSEGHQNDLDSEIEETIEVVIHQEEERPCPLNIPIEWLDLDEERSISDVNLSEKPSEASSNQSQSQTRRSSFQRSLGKEFEKQDQLQVIRKIAPQTRAMTVIEPSHQSYYKDVAGAGSFGLRHTTILGLTAIEILATNRPQLLISSQQGFILAKQGLTSSASKVASLLRGGSNQSNQIKPSKDSTSSKSLQLAKCSKRKILSLLYLKRELLCLKKWIKENWKKVLFYTIFFILLLLLTFPPDLFEYYADALEEKAKNS